MCDSRHTTLIMHRSGLSRVTLDDKGGINSEQSVNLGPPFINLGPLVSRLDNIVIGREVLFPYCIVEMKLC